MVSEIAALEFSDVEIMPEGMIIAIYGIKGSAKSCVGAVLLEGARLRENRPIFYFPESYRFHAGTALEIQDLINGHEKLRGAIVLVDEWQRLMNKYMAASLANQNIAGLLEQIRKLGIVLIVTSNNEGMIDLDAFDPHVDLRLDTVKLRDERCYELQKRGARFHLKDCTDSAIVTVTDVTGKHGRSRHHWDGKKRFVWIVRRLIDYYKIYNTYATVNAMEIRAMDADAVRQSHDDAESGMPFDQFLNMIATDFIPLLVSEGAVELVIYPFTKWLADRGVTASADRIIKACKTIGLMPVRGSGGNRFKLPPQEEMAGWLSGVIAGS